MAFWHSASPPLIIRIARFIHHLQSAAGFLTYFVVMGENGFMPYSLIGLSRKWNDKSATVQDSYGQDWVSG